MTGECHCHPHCVAFVLCRSDIRSFLCSESNATIFQELNRFCLEVAYAWFYPRATLATRLPSVQA